MDTNVIQFKENAAPIASEILLKDLRMIFDKLAGQDWSIMTSDVSGLEITIKFNKV